MKSACPLEDSVYDMVSLAGSGAQVADLQTENGSGQVLLLYKRHQGEVVSAVLGLGV